METLKIRAIRRQRAFTTAGLFCATMLFIYAAISLSGQTKHRSTASLVRGLFRPSYCASIHLEWLNTSSTTQGIVQPTSGHETSISLGAAVHRGPESAAAAAAATYDALHQVPEKDLQLAASIWRSHSAKSDVHSTPSPVMVHEAHLNLSAMLSGLEPRLQGEVQGSSSGRGIVMVSGGPTYSPPAYGSIAFLRRSGCKLPVEVWTPPHEPIPQGVAAELIALGNVSLRSLAVYPLAAHDAMRTWKHLGKQLGILASQFLEILFLDADNLVLRDPAFLFEEPLYKQSGLLMWPDFWSSQVKAGAWEALQIPSDQRPTGSHESGQMVLHKQRCWKPLLVSIFLNTHGGVFYPLLSDTGQGDKETLPMSWLAVGHGEYGLIPHPVLAVGRFMPDGSHAGHAMLQRGPDGLPLFLHAHLPKITVPRGRLTTPPDVARAFFELHTEVTVFPKGFDKAKARSYEVLNAVAGFDVEVDLLHLRQYLGCHQAWVECCLQ